MIARRTYNAAQLLQALQGAVPLRDAVEQFEPQLERDELARLAKERRTLTASGKKWQDAGIAVEGLFGALAKMQTRLAVSANARVSQETQLVAALESGQLLAIGYDVAKGTAAKPELVPRFLLQRQFAKFTKSEFRDGEWRFAKVCIVPASALAESKIGRPSIRKHVFGIAEEIENEIRDMPPKVQAREIRNRGKIQFPTIFFDETPDDRTIERHLKLYWDR